MFCFLEENLIKKKTQKLDVKKKNKVTLHEAAHADRDGRLGHDPIRNGGFV